MNLVVALSELGKARRFVRDGRKCMIRQRRIVEHLERRGHDAFEAIQFLECLEEMQQGYIAHRNRLEQHVLVLVRPEEE